jgi:hypothetical protein
MELRPILRAGSTDEQAGQQKPKCFIAGRRVEGFAAPARKEGALGQGA